MYVWLSDHTEIVLFVQEKGVSLGVVLEKEPIHLSLLYLFSLESGFG